MSRRPLTAASASLAAAVLAALAFAGCGGAEPGAGPLPVEPRAAKASTAPSAGGLTVGATDLRLGDATTAHRRGGGVRRLPVPRRRIDPKALRRAGNRLDGVAAGAICENADVLPEGANTHVIAAAMLCLLNGERLAAGVGPLTASDALAAAALGHSQDMVSNQYFSHVAADGRDLVDRIRPTGYMRPDRGWSVGENIAWGGGTLASARNIVAAWMASEGHKENLLQPAFRDIGIGIASGNPRSSDGTGATFTTVFGLVGDPEAGSPAPATDAPRVAIAPGRTESRTGRKTVEHRAGRRRAKAARARAAKRRARLARARARVRPARDRA